MGPGPPLTWIKCSIRLYWADKETYSIFQELLHRVEEGEDAVPLLLRVEPGQLAQVLYHPSQQGLRANIENYAL